MSPTVAERVLSESILWDLAICLYVCVYVCVGVCHIHFKVCVSLDINLGSNLCSTREISLVTTKIAPLSAPHQAHPCPPKDEIELLLFSCVEPFSGKQGIQKEEACK